MEITELKAKLFDIQAQIKYLDAAYKKGMEKLRDLLKESDDNGTSGQEDVS